MKLSHRNPKFICGVLSLLLFASLAVPVHSQNSRGTILGHVKDSSGAAVQGAKITARNVNTAVSNEFTTGVVGDFVFVDLIPGTYTLSAEAQGFKTDRSTGLILEVDQTLRQDFTLVVGNVREEVSVTADTQMVQTDNTTTGLVLDQKTIEELPLNGRDFTNLLNLTAGATNLSGGTQATGYVLHGLANGTFTEVSLNGARPDSISFMVDGVTDNDAFFSGSSSVPSEFALQEVKIQTGLYSAEYGQGSGQVNVAIKSGTNQWHGQAYDYIQNDMFNPESPLIKAFDELNNATNPLKTPFKQNQFGGTLGGPVKIPWLYNGVNKSFWFVAYDGGRRSFFSGLQTAIQVPTQQERTGNFSDWPYPIYDPSTTGSVAPTPADPSGRTPFPNNQITNINTIGQKLANLYPAPNINCAFPCNNYVQQIHNSIDTDNITMRVDQNFREKDRIFFTGHIRQDDEPSPSQLPYTGSTASTHGRLFGLNWQHSFSANTVNEARVGYNHQWFHSGDDTAYGPNLSAQLGFSNSAENPALYGIPQINQDYSYSSIGNNNPGTSTKHTSWQFVDNLKLIRGKHTLTVGADIRRLREFESDTYQGIGTLNFDGKYTASDPANAGASPGADFGNPTADMLLGDPVSVTPPYPLGVDLLDVRGTNWNFFFQDDLRVTPRLTVNLGLRYELPPNFHSVNNSGWTLDPNSGGSLSWASQSFVQGVENTATAQGITVNPNFLNCCVPNTLVPIDKKDFAPRIGISWRPFPTDRFVVRAGYGIFYDTYMRYYDLVQNFDSNALQTQFPNSYPSGTGQETVSPVQLNTLWLPTVSSSQFFSLPGWDSPGFSSPILNQVEWPYNHNPYIQQWTLDTQYALSQTLLLDIGYVGSHDTHLPTQNLYNAAYQPTAAAAADPCNYSSSTGVIFDASQLPSGSPCLTDPNFSPVDTRVPYPNLPSIVYVNANVLSANYNALQVQLRQRFWRGLTYQVSYAWSRAFDEASGIVNVGGISEFIQDPHNIKGDYGPASFDQPQRVTASASWDLPVGKGRHWSVGWANWIVGGWKLSGINTLTSGRTFSVYPYGFYDSVDLTGSNFGGRYRANEISDPHTGFSRSPSEWFNTGAFVAPPVGTYGNELKGSLRGPYFEDLDLSFGKEFPITERQKLQYRLEIFNVGSNWHSMARIPDGGMGDNNFGSIVPFNSPGLPANDWNNLNLWTPHTIQMSLVYSF